MSVHLRRKRSIIGIIFERCTKAHVNEQGKLSIPKALLDHPGLEAGEGLVLVGRGDFIEILNEEKPPQTPRSPRG